MSGALVSCGLCGIASFDNVEDAKRHMVDPDHLAKKAEKDAERQAAAPARTPSGQHHSQPVPPRVVRRLGEGKQWDLTVPGTDLLNLGSNEFDQTTDMVREAHYQISAYAGDQQATTGVDPEFTFDDVAFVAEALLAAADVAQAAIRPDKKPNRMDTSYRRATAAVKTVIKTNPLKTLERDQLAEWAADLTEAATTFLRVAYDLYRRNNGLDFDPPVGAE